MTVRVFQPHDENAVVNLWDICNLLVSYNDPNRDIAMKLAVQPELMLVGTIDQSIVSAAMVGFDGCRGRVNYLSVHPDRRALGLGRRMLDEAQRRLAELGCARITLQVRTTNTKVIGFYHSMGYEQQDFTSLGMHLSKNRPGPALENGLTVQPCQPPDRTALLDLWQSCGPMYGYEAPERDLESMLGSHPAMFLVGKLEGRVAASLMAGYEGHRAWLHYLAVQPELRRKGFGRSMVRAAHARLETMGCPKINLQVHKERPELIEFFYDYGFKEDKVFSFSKSF